jgi:hypothetical protein
VDKGPAGGRQRGGPGMAATFCFPAVADAHTFSSGRGEECPGLAVPGPPLPPPAAPSAPGGRLKVLGIFVKL